MQGGAGGLCPAGTREDAAHAAKSTAYAGESLEARATEQTPDAAGAPRASRPGGQLDIETTSKTFHLPNVRQQLPLGQRQPRHHSVATGLP